MISTPKTPGRLRAVPLAVPLILVNAAAIWGQSGWAYEHITPAAWQPLARLTLAVLFALAVESVGVYLAWEAHAALMADQAAGLLRLGSYGIGLLVGALNYAHFAGGGYTPTAQAVAFGLLSAISPWLWAIRSRSLNRGRLAELGLIDERGVKLSTSRKLWHPWRSVAVMSWAAWAGVTSPSAAVAGWEASRRKPEDATEDATETVSGQLVPAVYATEEAPGESPGGAARSVVLSATEAQLIAQALRAHQPDMTYDRIAQLVGRAPRSVQRYIGGGRAEDVAPEPESVNGADLADTIAVGA